MVPPAGCIHCSAEPDSLVSLFQHPASQDRRAKLLAAWALAGMLTHASAIMAAQIRTKPAVPDITFPFCECPLMDAVADRTRRHRRRCRD
jgi:hypothetical protein